MIRFFTGIVVGILIFFLFLYFGGGRSIKKLGEGLVDTGKRMEAVEELARKEKEETIKGIKKKIIKEGEVRKGTQ